jgi:hypothetical protein
MLVGQQQLCMLVSNYLILAQLSHCGVLLHAGLPQATFEKASRSSGSSGMHGSSISSTLLERGANVSSSGSLNTTAERCSSIGVLNASTIGSTSSCGDAGGGLGAAGSGGVSPTRGAGRSVRMSMLGMQRRSAVGAALEAHVAADAAQAEQQQVG